MPSLLEPPWLFIATGIGILMLDLLVGVFAFRILRWRLKRWMFDEAGEIEKETGIRISNERMQALRKEFSRRLNEEISRAKIKEILASHRETLRNLFK